MMFTFVIHNPGEMLQKNIDKMVTFVTSETQYSPFLRTQNNFDYRAHSPMTATRVASSTMDIIGIFFANIVIYKYLRMIFKIN